MAKGDSLFAVFYDGKPITSEFIKEQAGQNYTPVRKVFFYRAQAENAVSKLPSCIDRDKTEIIEYIPVKPLS
jgi:hypothetical protein